MRLSPATLARLAALLAAAAAPAPALPAQGDSAPPAAEQATPVPELVEIDYKSLFRRLMQLGMVSQVLGYSLTVDAEGKATDCTFSRRFDSAYVNRELCRAFLRNTRFEPARDTEGRVVPGTYENEIEIASFFKPTR